MEEHPATGKHYYMKKSFISPLFKIFFKICYLACDLNSIYHIIYLSNNYKLREEIM